MVKYSQWSLNVKSTGIVRKVDPLGRILIPKELRRKFMIDEKDPLEIFVEGDTINLKAYKPLCIFCGSSDDMKQHMNKNVCSDCRYFTKKL